MIPATTASALDVITTQLNGIKFCAPAGIHRYFAPALGPFRFLPAPERRACADTFRKWGDEHTATAPVVRAYAMVLQAMDRFIVEDFEPSLRLLTDARAIFVEHSDNDGIGLCAMLTGAIYRTFGNYDLAMKTLWEGFELLKGSGHYPIFLAANANSMANIDLDLGHLDDAIAMFTVTYDESAKADDFYFMVYALHGLGRVYLRQGKPAERTDALQRALSLAEQHQHPLLISNSLTELATDAFDSGDLATAETLSTHALAIREGHGLIAGAITNCMRLGDIHACRQEKAEALKVLTRALQLAEETKVKPKMAQAHQLLSGVYEQFGDLELSLSHFKRYHELREQIEREDVARKLADAKLVFDAEQTKKENAVIKQQKLEIEQKNVELQDTIDELTRAKIGRKARAFTLGVAVVLFVFQDLILGSVLRVLPSNYFVLLAAKMAIIFTLAPINRGIERHLLRRVARKG